MLIKEVSNLLQNYMNLSVKVGLNKNKGITIKLAEFLLTIFSTKILSL